MISLKVLPVVVQQTPVKTRQFAASSSHRTMSRLTRDTIRRRLEFPAEEEDIDMDEEAKFLNRIPLKAKKKGLAVADDNREEFQHVEKKLKTAAADVHNNNTPEAGEDPAVLAAALSRAQLLTLVAGLSAGAGGRARLRALLPSPDLAPRLASLTYHLHNIHRSQPAR